MNAPSMPLDAQKRRDHIIREVKNFARLEEPFIHRMIADFFVPQAHEHLWRDKFASVCPNVRNWVIDLHTVSWFFPKEMTNLFVKNYPCPASSANISPEYAAFFQAKIRERDGTFVAPDMVMWRQLRPQVNEGHPGVYGLFHIVLSRELTPANKIWHELETNGQQDKFINFGLVRLRISRDVTQNTVVYQLVYSTNTSPTSVLLKPALGQAWLNLVGWACDVLLLSHNPQLQPSYHVWLEKHVANGCVTNLSPHKELMLVQISEYARMLATFKAALPQAELLLADMALDDVTLQRAMTDCEKLCSGLPPRYAKLLVWVALYKDHALDPYLVEHYPHQGLGITMEVLKDLFPKFCEWKGRQYVEHWIEENPLSLPRTKLQETAQKVLKDMTV